MREILFKGKRKDNGKWVESCSINFQIDIYGNQHIYMGLPVCSERYSNMVTIEWVEVIPETVGQHTGLTDKNGTKIFEGDVVKGYWKTVFQVVYDNCYSGFRAKEKDGREHFIDYYGLHRIEVIGNIHDNPELLKEME